MKYATPKQLAKLMSTEQELIGCIEYEARYGYFHNYEYRHYLRYVPHATYLRVYRALLKAKLDPMGESPKHLAIILKVTKQKE